MHLEDYFEFDKVGDRDTIRIKGTRVGVEILLEEFSKGMPPEEIHKSYPTVTREQIYATITYYLHDQDKMDAYLKRSREAAEAAYQEWLRNHTPSPLEERLRKLRESSTADNRVSA